MKPVEFSEHAAERALERVGVGRLQLAALIEQGQAVRLPTLAHDGALRGVRSGYLVYLSEGDLYCLVIMSDLDRAGITVLTEDMALNSRWSEEINAMTRLKARQRRELPVRQTDVILAKSRGRDVMALRASARTFNWNWRPQIFSLGTLQVEMSQIDSVSEACRLTEGQIAQLREQLAVAVEAQRIRPYGDILLARKTSNMPALGAIPGFGSFEDGQLASRWL